MAEKASKKLGKAVGDERMSERATAVKGHDAMQEAGTLDRLFKLKENGTTVKTEIIAGFTTFMTMAYIIIVNPSILSITGMDVGALTTVTILSAAFATLIMGFYANYPFALAPGMGLNAFFTFYVVTGPLGLPWEAALSAVFISGLIFIILTVTKAREAIVNSIPMTLKYAVSVGIGLFIALIGFNSAGFITANPDTLVALGDFTDPKVLLAAFGLLLTAVLVVKKVKGALLFGIIATTIVGMPFGLVNIPTGISDIVGMPASPAPIFGEAVKWANIQTVLSVGLIPVIFSFTFVDLFDTVGTLIGVSSKAGLLDKEGKLPRVNKALMADALGTVAGSIMGTSTVTTYIESASGVAEGGRTGLTAVTTAVLFLVALIFSPIVYLIPGAATAPVLIIVGIFMMEPVMKIDFTNYLEAIPAFLAITLMPFSYSIAEGIVFGVLAYVLLRILTGKTKEISLTMWILSILFVIRFFV